MIKFSKIFVLVICGCLQLNAQGFDWQYSPRLPFNTPTQFLGINVSGSFNLNTGDFGFLSNNIPCCTFENGTGYGILGGLKYEKWITDNSTIFSTLDFSYIPSIFITQSEPYVYRDYEDIRTEYEYNSTLTYIILEIGYKYRLFESHFYTSLSLNSAFLTDEKHNFIERIVSEKDFFFSEIKYPNPEYSKPNKLMINPVLYLGYDLNLGMGKYASVFISTTFPLQSVIADKNWNRWIFSFGLTSYLFSY